MAPTNTWSCPTGKIPEEAKALSLLAPAAPVPNLIPGGGLLPIPTPAPIQNVSKLLKLYALTLDQIVHQVGYCCCGVKTFYLQFE